MKPFESNGTDLENGELERDKDKATRSNVAISLYNQALVSGFAYCISSCSMILVNKFVLSSYNFNAGIFLMLYQVIFVLLLILLTKDLYTGFSVFFFFCAQNISWDFGQYYISMQFLKINKFIILLWMQNLISVIIVSILSLLGVISTERLTWRLVRVWLPVNVIFVGMLVTSMFRYDVGMSFFFFFPIDVYLGATFVL